MTVVLYFAFFFAVIFNAANGLPRQEDVSIVGGIEVDISDFPYQVLLQYGGRALCGGSIISHHHILTAAHCVNQYELGMLSVRIGSSYVSKGGQVYKVKNKFVHPKYRDRNVDYDFAVLRVAERMAIDNKTSLIVKMADAGSSVNPGDNIVVTGWGKLQEAGHSAEKIRAVAVPVVSLQSCKQAYGAHQISERMFCAGVRKGGKDACQGDSGGPAVFFGDQYYGIQYGIVSWGQGCARPGYPGVYSNIPAARDWIREVSGV